MNLNRVSRVLVLPLVLSCARGGDSDAPDKREPPVVDAQTTGNGQKTQKKPTPTTPQVATPTGTGPAAPAANQIAMPAPVINKADISGWWMSPNDASASEDAAFAIGTNGLKCKSFSLINETKLKLARGWECWDYSKNIETFHVARLGTIVSLNNGQMSYGVTAGCDAGSINSVQLLNFVKGTGANNRQTLSVSTATSANLLLNKMTPGPTVEGWILQPTATNWTVRVGCLDGSGNFVSPPGITSDVLFDLAK